ncbi:MAG: MFS transporter [Alicyclobacillus sp.]|nr:MFS transporter [Alicyclobacillus sp.]
MSLLRNRQFAILFSGQMISVLGTNLFVLALPWYVYLSTGSKQDLAIVGFVQSLPGVAGLFAGVFVDRWNKRRTMIGADALRGTLSIAIGVFALLGFPFPWIVAAVLVMQVIGVVFGPAQSVLLPMVVGEDQVSAAMGLNQSGAATAQLAGQLGGGALLTALGAPVLFFANGISFLVSVVSLLFIRAPEPPRQTKRRSFFAEWREGLVLVGRSKMIMLVISAALVANFGMAAFDIALTAWVRGPLHASAMWLGVIGAAFFVGVIVGGVLLGTVTRHVALKQMLMIGLIAVGVFIGTVGIFANVWWSTGILLVSGIISGIVNGALNAMAIQVVPAAIRGRVFGLLNALATMATPLGMAIFGGLMVYVSLPLLFMLMGSFSVLSGIAFLLPIRDDTAALHSVEASHPMQVQ